jgi:hypothetical protein
MKTKVLLKKLAAHKGPVLVSVNNFNDSFYIQVVKSDFITQISAAFSLDAECGFRIDENGYIDKDEANLYGDM